MPTASNEFEAQIAPFRGELHAYCYRMLGSLQDAEDALQEAMLGAWRGLARFEGRSSLRSWLYRIATNACLRVIAERKPRVLPVEYSAAASGVELDPMVERSLWIEPYPDPPSASYEVLESVELAFIAALQHLPGTQRATLILREVLGFSAEEVAVLLETSVVSVNSALQRARASVDERVPPMSQQATLRTLGDDDKRDFVSAYVTAWGRGDTNAIVALLAKDAKFSMPPFPTWFHGREAIGRFFAERVFATAWRLEPVRASGQLAFVCYQGPLFGVGALNVVTLEGRSIAEMTGFLEPAVHAHFLPSDR